MDTSIKAVFDDACGKLVLNPRYLDRLEHYVISFINRSKDHITFFGGNLTGVEVVRFKDADRHRWFDELLEVDELLIEDRIHALPTVNTEFFVSSDVMNLSCLWLTHAFFHAKHLTPDQRRRGQHAAIMVLQIRFLTSRLFRHFRYPADRALAEATYAELSNKFSLKQHGSWKRLLDARADEIISEDSIHYQTFKNFFPDEEVINTVNDIQGRIRSIVKNIFGVFMQVAKQGSRVLTTSSVVEHDGVEILKDRTKSNAVYLNYINSTITDKNAFVKDELIRVVEKMMPTMSDRLFRQTLGWLSDNYRQRGAGLIEEVVSETLVHVFQYMQDNRNLIKNKEDLPTLLSRIRGVYMSSRSTDPVLMSLREKTEKIVSMATSNKNASILAAVRTGVLLYIVVRTITMKHYATNG